MKILVENQIFSPDYVFAEFGKSGHVLLEGHENYQKRSYRNRYFIQSSRGVLGLSIPLKKGKHQQQPIREVSIAYDEDWSKQHRHTIQSAYGNSPFFEHYFPVVQDILESRVDKLFDFNLQALQKISKALFIPLKIEITDAFFTGEVPDILNLKNSDKKPIESYPVQAPYQQVWSQPGQFIYHLSILDSLFCVGPQSMHVLKNMY